MSSAHNNKYPKGPADGRGNRSDDTYPEAPVAGHVDGEADPAGRDPI